MTKLQGLCSPFFVVPSLLCLFCSAFFVLPSLLAAQEQTGGDRAL
ncbi:MAG: hypothetical protein NW220_10580 [Leptolyngbyaceae cyanobacterium bins.349]|nr:hypothetical protein [Leptolyngbyaceae cyanobacterium bins.349]